MSESNTKNGVGRPNKKGLDYFAHLVKHSDEERILISKYGCNGYAVYYSMREKVTENGYYYELTDRKSLLICSELNIEKSLFNEIISFTIELELFDKRIFDKYKVLTSERLQIDYIIAASRRTKIDIIEEYILYSEDTFYREINDTKIKEKVNIYSISANINSNNANRKRQSKVKNSKSIVENSNSKAKEKKSDNKENAIFNEKEIIKGSAEGKKREKTKSIDDMSDDEFKAMFSK